MGGAIGGTGTTLEIDTVEIGQLRTDTLVAFSGNLPFISAGRFEDPLFGNVNAMALVKPRLASNNGNGIFGDSTKMSLRLAINEETVYGDTLSQAQFDLVEIAELWRQNAWQLNDEIALSSTVGSFTVADEDTIEIPLPSGFVQKYGEFYNSEDSLRDSTYVRNFFGLALQPKNSSKIITINTEDSRFIATDLDVSEDTTLNDSLSIGFRDAAYSVDRTNVPMGNPATKKIYNTLEQVITFDFDFSSDNIETLNISKAELIIYRDQMLLQESIAQAGPNAVRPDVQTLNLHLVEGDELPQSIDPGNPLAQGTFEEEDNGYHFNLTQLINQGVFESVSPSLSFYVTLGSNDGVIRSDVLFTGEAEDNAPKVIITSINNE